MNPSRIILLVLAVALLGGGYLVLNRPGNDTTDKFEKEVANRTHAASQSNSDVTGSTPKRAAAQQAGSDSANSSLDEIEVTTHVNEQHPSSGAVKANSASQKSSPQRLEDSYEPSTESMNDHKQTWPSDAQGISGAVGESLSEINDCYSAWLAAEKTKNLVGEVKIAFTLELDPSDTTKGKITDARVVSSQLNNRLLEACVLSVVSALKFDPPQEKMVVEYPFRFSKE